MPSESDATFVIGAPGIDSEAILRQVDANASGRTPLPHAAAALGRAHLVEERLALLSALNGLKHSMRDYGLVDTHRHGWLGGLELFVKRCVRKLFFRHILQQQRVHLKMTTFLGQVIAYLETSDQTWRASLDHCERRIALAERVRRSPQTPDRDSARSVQSIPR